MLDASPLGRMSAEMMERVSDTYGEESKLREIVIVVEVDHGDSTSILVHGSDDRPWVTQSFLCEAADEYGRMRDAVRGEAEDE